MTAEQVARRVALTRVRSSPCGARYYRSSSFSCPSAGLGLLLADARADVRWEDHPAHFWLVFASGGGQRRARVTPRPSTARRRADARLLLVSLAFLCAAGFLGLHALATPKVLLDGPNQGFVLATPSGLGPGRVSWRRRPPRRCPSGALTGSSVTRASCGRACWRRWFCGPWCPWPRFLRSRIRPRPSGRAALLGMALAAWAFYAYAAGRYFVMYLRSRAGVLLSVSAAFVLLGEAMVAVALARSWHATWWEWHLLMLVAFGAIALTVQRQGPAERFSDLYLEETAAGNREVSVLFADLAGFTSFSEGRNPREVQRDAEFPVRGHDPADREEARGRDRPPDRRRDHGHLQHARRPTRPRPQGGGGGARPSARERGPAPSTPTGRASGWGSAVARRSWGCSVPTAVAATR